MKKLIKNLTLICITMFFILNSIIVTKVLEVSPSSTSQSFVNAQTTAQNAIESSEYEDSIFLIDIAFARVYDDLVYVYDNSDSTIKILEKETNSFREVNNHYRAYGIKDILIYKDVMMMLSNETKTFTCINKNTFESVNFDQSALTTLSNAKTIKYISIGGKDYLLLCPENPIDGIGEFELAELEEGENAITIKNVSKFSVGSGFSVSLSQYNNIYIDEIDGKLFIMLVTGNYVYSFSVNVNNVSSVYTTLTDVNGLDSETYIHDISDVTLADQSEVLAVTYAEKILFYNLEIGEDTVDLNLIEDKIINIDNTFTISSADGQGSTLAIVSNGSQELKVYDFLATGDSFYSEEKVENSQITIEYFSNTKLKYVNVVKATRMLELPYSKTSEIIISENEQLVVIGKGVDALGYDVYGWDYCMYTTDGVNNYGFVASIDTNEKVPTVYNKQYVTVQAYTNLYTLPSKISDQTNLEIKVIPTFSRLEVLDSVCDYTSLNTSYLLVKVNGESIGFIDRARIVKTTGLGDRIIPDATVMRNDSEIFTTTADDRETILTLDKGARVKVIGKRDTITNFTLVTFNDSEGNEYTGYIYTYNLEPDSWTTLQVIGMFLVIINVVLLVVIIVLKNKLAR